MAEKVAGVEGGLVSSARAAGVENSPPRDLKRSKTNRGKGKEQLANDELVEEKQEPADEDIYEMDEQGNILMDASGNPVRLPPPVDVEPLYENLTSFFPIAMGKSTSRKERIAKSLTSSNLLYSEVTFDMMASIMRQLKELGVLKRKQGKFFDLGAGVGKAVIAAAMLHPFASCVGIEVLENIHATSMEMLRQFNAKIATRLHHVPTVGFVLGDIAEVDWKSATVLFINMTTYTEELIEEIKATAGEMKRGTICITVTKQLRSKAWEVVHVSEEKLNWGQSHVYIHQKVL